MSKGKPTPLRSALDHLIALGEPISPGDLARRAGVTRQAAHRVLVGLVDQGRLRRSGAGRATRYVPAFDVTERHELAGLDEDSAWSGLATEPRSLGDATDAARRAARYTFTEMVNNAIDHSNGTIVEISAATDAGHLRFRVADDGVGAFRHLASRLALPDEEAAAFELTKGKRTTAPDAHSGEGVFFTSRIAERFRLDANGLALVVVASLDDFAIARSDVVTGTTVSWEIDRRTDRTLEAVFGRHTNEDLAFMRTRIPLAALLGSSMISRAEARRVTDQLERFAEVELDFTGVTEVGHAFLDEVFRVWPSRHPTTVVRAVGADPVIDRQIDALRATNA